MKTIFSPALLLAASLGLMHAPLSLAADTSAPQTGAGMPDINIAESRDPAMLTQLAGYFRQNGDTAKEVEALQRRTELRPHIGQYRLDLAVAYARENKKSEAYTTLVELQNAGYSYDLADDARFEKIADTKVWEYLLEHFKNNGEPFGDAELAYTLPAEDLLAESLSFDPTRGKLLVGSARKGKVYTVESDGKLNELASADSDNGMWAVFDLVVDAKRGFLWVASTAVPHFEGYDPQKHLGRAGVFQFDLKNGKFIKSFLSPPAQGGQPFYLTSIALGNDGEVYAADGVNRAIYQVRDGSFRRLLHMPMLTSISSITVSGDGRKLYMADPQLGILGIDLATTKPFDVRVPPKLSLEGISSLSWHDGALIAVQSGMRPARIMRFNLSPQGDVIGEVLPLLANHPLFGRLGLGTVEGDQLYLVANDQKDNYDRYGLVKKKDQLEGTRIVRTSVIATSSDPTTIKQP